MLLFACSSLYSRAFKMLIYCHTLSHQVEIKSSYIHTYIQFQYSLFIFFCSSLVLFILIKDPVIFSATLSSFRSLPVIDILIICSTILMPSTNCSHNAVVTLDLQVTYEYRNLEGDSHMVPHLSSINFITDNNIFQFTRYLKPYTWLCQSLIVCFVNIKYGRISAEIE